MAYGREILWGVAQYVWECGPWTVYIEQRSLTEQAPLAGELGRRRHHLATRTAPDPMAARHWDPHRGPQRPGAGPVSAAHPERPPGRGHAGRRAPAGARVHVVCVLRLSPIRLVAGLPVRVRRRLEDRRLLQRVLSSG